MVILLKLPSLWEFIVNLLLPALAFHSHFVSNVYPFEINALDTLQFCPVVNCTLLNGSSLIACTMCLIFFFYDICLKLTLPFWKRHLKALFSLYLNKVSDFVLFVGIEHFCWIIHVMIYFVGIEPFVE